MPTGSEERGVLGLGVFLLQYLHLVKKIGPCTCILFHYIRNNMNHYYNNIQLGSKNMENLRANTWASIHHLAIILTTTLWALDSIITQGSIVVLINTASSVFLILLAYMLTLSG